MPKAEVRNVQSRKAAQPESVEQARDTHRSRMLGLALVLLTLVVYLPVRQHGFIDFDDPENISENRMVQAGLTWSGVKWAFSSFDASMWLPLTRLSHMLDCELFGLDPGAHHLVNVVLHAANAVLLFVLLFRLTRGLWPAAVVAALFAWHPLRVESVAWAVERKDVLSTFFFMLTLLTYVGSVKFGVRSAERGARNEESGRWSYYGLSLVFFVLALMSKPMVVTLPFVLLLLDYWPLRRFEIKNQKSKIKNLLWEKAPFFLLSAAASVVTLLAARGNAIGLVHYSFGWRVANALVSYVRYLGKTVWPANLAVLYPFPQSWPWPMIGLAAAVLVAISWFCWKQRQRRPHLLMGWLWFLGMLLPVSGLIQVGRQAMADRFTYVPLIGVFIAVVFEAREWIARWRMRPPLVAAVTSVLLLGCLGGTARQLGFWINSETLFRHTLAVTRDNGIAHLNLGVALEESGRSDEALKEYKEAARLEPGFAQVHNNLGNLLLAQGRTTDALDQYREGLRLDPEAPMLHENVGTLLVQLGQFDEAMREYEEAARLAPKDPRPHYLMAKAWLRQARPQNAVEQFQQALALDPNDLQSLLFLARLRAAYPDSAFRNGAQAVALAERATSLSGEARPFVLDTLAMAYMEAERCADAQKIQSQAIDRARVTGEPQQAVNEMTSRLFSYQSCAPYRDPFTNSPPRAPISERGTFRPTAATHQRAD